MIFKVKFFSGADVSVIIDCDIIEFKGGGVAFYDMRPKKVTKLSPEQFLIAYYPSCTIESVKEL